MMNNNSLTVITDREILGKRFQMYGTKENPLFLAKDVAYWIEHSNPRMMLQNVDEDEKVVRNAYTLGGNQEQWFLTENGLYEVLMQSRKPIAKAFKKEVKKILKEIRLTGRYEAQVPAQTQPTQPQLPTNFKEALLMLVQAEEEKELLELENKQIKQIAEKSIEKVEVFDRVFNKKGFDVGQVAKALEFKNFGRTKMFRYLKEIKWVTKDGQPMQTGINSGYVVGVPASFITSGHYTVNYTKTLLTEKGIRKLYSNLSAVLEGRKLKSIESILQELGREA